MSLYVQPNDLSDSSLFDQIENDVKQLVKDNGFTITRVNNPRSYSNHHHAQFALYNPLHITVSNLTSDDTLFKEPPLLKQIKDCVTQALPLKLKFHKLLMTPSFDILATFLPEGDGFPELRTELDTQYRASSPTIYHMTVARLTPDTRVVKTQQLTDLAQALSHVHYQGAESTIAINSVSLVHNHSDRGLRPQKTVETIKAPSSHSASWGSFLSKGFNWKVEN